MEGFLMKKARGESTLGRKNWKQRWFALEGQYLFYYEGFDRDRNEPLNRKGVIPLAGCELKLVAHQQRQNVFVIKHPNRRPLYLDAETENLKFIWLEALEKASKGETPGSGAGINLDEYLELLGLPTGGPPPEAAAIHKAYKRAALRAHPDKGGDVMQFKKVQEAFEILTSVKEEEEEDKLYETVQFQAVIEKGPPGVGFGMVVVEDQKKAEIVVKKVLECMQVLEMDEEAGGKIKAKDKLVGIDNDEIKGWSLPRVVQRLNDFRVPVGRSVRLTFTRRRRIDGQPDEEEPEEEPVPDVPSPPYSPDTGRDSTQGEDREQQSAPFYGTMPPGANDGSAEGDGDDFEPNTSKSGWTDTGELDPVMMMALRAEVEELREESERSRKELMSAMQERDEAHSELEELKEQLTVAKAETGSLLRQVESAESSRLEAERRANRAEVQLQQVILNSEMSREKAAKEMKDVRDVANQILARREISVGDEVEEYLTKVGLSRESVGGSTVKTAQRSALAAAASVDSTGLLLKKWSLQGESAADKLSRLEARLSRLDGPSPETAQQGQALQEKLSHRPDREELHQQGILQSNDDELGPSMGHIDVKDAQSKVNQHLRFRPNRQDLYESHILPEERHENVM